VAKRAIDPNQTNFEFTYPVHSTRPIALVSLDEIYANASQELLGKLEEDRRFERKPAGIKPYALQDWFSMFANTTPEGGLIAIGVADKGTIEGCSRLSQSQINDLEKMRNLVFDSHPRSRRVPVMTEHGEDFVILYRVPYNETMVVETSDGRAFIRVGDECHLMADQEKQEIAADKGQVQTELQPVPDYKFPDDFDLNLIKMFADGFRQDRGLSRDRLPDIDILKMRHLGKISDGQFEPNLLSLV
jgi:ATP-dependent DNA helicase RecG